MKTIIQRSYLLAAIAGLGMVVSVLIFFFGKFMPGNQTHLLMTLTLTTSAFMTGLWVREYRKLVTARLIVENQILHIRPAFISNSANDISEPDSALNIDVFISYFGILLDTKIIKFNQDGILLKAVEIGAEFISLTYGTDKRIQIAWLLCAAIDNGELERIIEQFRFETGVIPVITNKKERV